MATRRKTPARGKNGRFKKGGRKKKATRRRKTTTRRKASTRRRKTTAKRSPTRRRRPAKKKATRRRVKRRKPEAEIVGVMKKGAAVGLGLALSQLVTRLFKTQTERGRAITAGLAAIVLTFLSDEIGKLMPFATRAQVQLVAVGIMADAAIRAGTQVDLASLVRLGPIAGRTGSIASGNVQPQMTAGESMDEFFSRLAA